MTDPTARQAETVAAETENTTAPEAADPVAEARSEAAEFKDKLLRTLAEMENLRKRTEREKAEATLYAATNFARDLLSVSDNMQRAVSAMSQDDKDGADPVIRNLIAGHCTGWRALHALAGAYGERVSQVDMRRSSPAAKCISSRRTSLTGQKPSNGWPSATRAPSRAT